MRKNLKETASHNTKENLGTRLMTDLLNFNIQMGKTSWWSLDGNTGKSLEMSIDDMTSDLQDYYEELQLDSETKVEVEKALMLLASIALKDNKDVVMLNDEYGELEIIGNREEVMETFGEYIEKGLNSVRL